MTSSPTASRPITLDFATDEHLDRSVAGLSHDDYLRLCRVVRRAQDTDFKRDLLGRLHTELTEKYPTRTAIGVLFDPTVEDNDNYFTSDGTVLFEDDTVDLVEFDDDLAQILNERWPNDIGSRFTVAVDLRSEGKITASDTNRDIYAWFNIPRPI